MNTFRYILLATLLASAAPSVVAKKGVGQACAPRVPAIVYKEAVEIAEAHYRSTQQPAAFIDEVMLQCKGQAYVWKVGFRLKKYESGQYVVYVSMDRSIKVSVIKDG